MTSLGNAGFRALARGRRSAPGLLRVPLVAEFADHPPFRARRTPLPRRPDHDGGCHRLLLLAGLRAPVLLDRHCRRSPSWHFLGCSLSRIDFSLHLLPNPLVFSCSGGVGLFSLRLVAGSRLDQLLRAFAGGHTLRRLPDSGTYFSRRPRNGRREARSTSRTVLGVLGLEASTLWRTAGIHSGTESSASAAAAARNQKGLRSAPTGRPCFSAAHRSGHSFGVAPGLPGYPLVAVPLRPSSD